MSPRRSPAWIREKTSAELHSMAHHLRRRSMVTDLTEGQEWLWSSLISELEFRQRRGNPAWLRCSCEFCIPPFPDADLDGQERLF